jgi:hypothetical protein
MLLLRSIGCVLLCLLACFLLDFTFTRITYSHTPIGFRYIIRQPGYIIGLLFISAFWFLVLFLQWYSWLHEKVIRFVYWMCEGNDRILFWVSGCIFWLTAINCWYSWEFFMIQPSLRDIVALVQGFIFTCFFVLCNLTLGVSYADIIRFEKRRKEERAMPTVPKPQSAAPEELPLRASS